MIVRLKNDIGMVKEAKIGFSFTTFFFGAFVPALRGDWKYRSEERRVGRECRCSRSQEH